MAKTQATAIVSERASDPRANLALHMLYYLLSIEKSQNL
jgi:hypothetical protein